MLTPMEIQLGSEWVRATESESTIKISITAQIILRARGGSGCKFGSKKGEMHNHVAGSKASTRAKGLSEITALRIQASHSAVLFGEDGTSHNNNTKRSEARAAAQGACLTDDPEEVRAMNTALAFIPEELAEIVHRRSIANNVAVKAGAPAATTKPTTTTAEPTTGAAAPGIDDGPSAEAPQNAADAANLETIKALSAIIQSKLKAAGHSSIFEYASANPEGAEAGHVTNKGSAVPLSGRLWRLAIREIKFRELPSVKHDGTVIDVGT